MKDERSAFDWVANRKSYVVLWVLPKIAIVGAMFALTTFGPAIWIAALVAMGAACLANSRRCGRVHCRYTGPYYLALTVPVLLFGAGILKPDAYVWLVLFVLSILGGHAITWVTETSQGPYESSQKSEPWS